MDGMTIMLRRDANSGKADIIVKLDKNAGALPLEHEEMHRRLVEKLTSKGAKPEEFGELIVEHED